MRAWYHPHSIRGRLTLWYAGSLAAVLTVYAAGVWIFLRQSLSYEFDRQLRDDFEMAEQMLERTPDGRVRWAARPHHHREGDQEEHGPWVEVWSPDGSLIHRTSAAAGGLTFERSNRFVQQGVSESVRLLNGTRLRTLTAPYQIGGRGFQPGSLPVVIRVARSEERLRHELAELLFGMGLGLPLAVGIAAVGGYILARRALAPVGELASRAKMITAERLGQRLPIENPGDELGHLAAVFNETLARLERSFEQLRRFTADASHELRTPLTAIRSVGEVALRERRNETSYREVIGSMLEEADRLGRLVDTLLTLSRADAGHVRLSPERVDLGELAGEVVNHLAVLAEEKGQSISLEALGTVEVSVDRLVLRQAAINLLDNAIKYSPEGSRIRIVVREYPRGASVEVIDTGPGIGPDHTERIFDRFYRIDKARSREPGGTGLGLSIARWAVEVHGGKIEVESQEGLGSTFRIVLPISREASIHQRR